MLIDPSLHITGNYKIRIKGKWSNLENRVALSPTLL